VVSEFATVLKLYALSSVTGDRYAGEWPREQFAKFGIRYEPAAKSKSDLYVDLLSLINSGRIELLDHPRSINQLLNLERRTARGGRESIDHPPNQHDDLANVIALASQLGLGGHLLRYSRFGQRLFLHGRWRLHHFGGSSREMGPPASCRLSAAVTGQPFF
jgi:hypothetical protein